MGLKTFSETKRYSGNGIGGVIALILSLVGFSFLLVFIQPSEIKSLYEGDQTPSPVSAKTGFWILLPIAGGFIWLWKVQGALNRFWQAHGAAA